MTLKLIVPLLLCAAFGAQARMPSQKPARPAPPAPPVVLPPATPDQFLAAAMTYGGWYTCELGRGLLLVQNLRHEGYVDLVVGKQVHTMKPVLSSTGVLRLEDVRGLLLLLQVPLKSMLLDVQSGRRLTDDCVTTQQLENRRAAAALPATPGLGLEVVRADAAAVAAAASAPAADTKARADPASSAASASASAEPASAAASGAQPEPPPAPVPVPKP